MWGKRKGSECAAGTWEFWSKVQIVFFPAEPKKVVSLSIRLQRDKRNKSATETWLLTLWKNLPDNKHFTFIQLESFLSAVDKSKTPVVPSHPMDQRRAHTETVTAWRFSQTLPHQVHESWTKWLQCSTILSRDKLNTSAQVDVLWFLPLLKQSNSKSTFLRCSYFCVSLTTGWSPFGQSNRSCGSDYITGVGGELTSPGYPAPYKPNLDCTWMIKVDPDEHILINFLALDMGTNGKQVVPVFLVFFNRTGCVSRDYNTKRVGSDHSQRSNNKMSEFGRRKETFRQKWISRHEDKRKRLRTLFCCGQLSSENICWSQFKKGRPLQPPHWIKFAPKTRRTFMIHLQMFHADSTRFHLTGRCPFHCVSGKVLWINCWPG